MAKNGKNYTLAFATFVRLWEKSPNQHLTTILVSFFRDDRKNLT